MSTVDNSLLERLKKIETTDPTKALAAGGGNDNTGGMDILQRVARLEDAVTGIRIDLAEIKGKLSHMPTTWSLILIVISVVFTVMSGTVGLFKLLHQ